MRYVKTILINGRYLIYPDGVVYDIDEGADISEYVFEIRDKLFKKKECA